MVVKKEINLADILPVLASRSQISRSQLFAFFKDMVRMSTDDKVNRLKMFSNLLIIANAPNDS